MKKCSLFFFLICLCAGLSAQYKKASFFQKTGRTYGLGAKLFAMGDGKGSPIGYTFSFGAEQDGKQFFFNTEITYLPSYDFVFNTTNGNGGTLSVYGKSKANLIFGYNFGYYLTKNENSEQLLRPYVTAGFNVSAFNGTKEVYNDSWDNAKVASESNFGAGIGGGLGCMLNFTPWLALKLEGGYSYQFNFKPAEQTTSTVYYMFTKHPYASVGLRFKIVTE